MSIRLDEDTLRELEEISRRRGLEKSKVIREILMKGLREFRIEEAVEAVRSGRATVWRAAEMAGLTYREMLRELRERNVPFPLSKEELEVEFSEQEEGGE